LGFARAVVPRPPNGITLARIDGLEVMAVETIADAIKLALGDRVAAPHGDAVPAMLG
jgi:hypothetical protein